MRLERVIAKDSRRATEQVIEQFGADALIISNQKVNGMTEIVVAVDIDAQPLDEPPINRQGDPEPVTSRQPIRHDPLARPTLQPRSEPSLRSLPQAPQDTDPDFEGGAAAPFAQVLSDSLGTARTATQVESSATASPRARSRADIPNWLSVAPKPERHEAPDLPATSTETPVAETDSLRARDLVDMVRAELASMRREIALSRQLAIHSGMRRPSPEIQHIADAFERADVPVSLRSLLLDQIADCTDVRQALEAIRSALCNSIKLSTERKTLEGVHVIAGPSGSGKTHMAYRLAARHASRRGTGSVALVSFADQRIGAWTQLQMLAAKSGIDCFKVADASLLGPLLGELSDRELILVDTSASGWKEGLRSIADCAPAARFHLVMPAEASASTLSRHQNAGGPAWHSLMLSKLDECPQPWPVIQALCNQEFALSLGSSDARPEVPPCELEPSDLVSQALSNCPGLVLEPVTEPARPRRTPVRKTTKDVRHAA